jgi:hypothetical protein
MLRSTLALLLALVPAGLARANTMTFDLGPGAVVDHGTVRSYTEDGMVAWFYGDAPDFIPNGSGYAIRVHLNNDILFEAEGGGTFDLTSFYFLGGGDTRIAGFHGNFSIGGQVGDVNIGLSGLAAIVHPAAIDSGWNGIDVVDWCGYCISGFVPENAIDDFTVNVDVPEPAELELLGIAFVMIAFPRRALRG